MSAEATPAFSVDPEGLWLYRVGGIAALVLGVAYVVTIPLFAHVGVPPSRGEAWLEYLPGKTAIWWVILGLMVLTDCLFVPVTLSLYLALRRVNGNMMLLATAFVGLFVVLDLAVTWTNYASLLTLSAWHAAATTEAQRAACLAAANHAAAVLASPIMVYYAIVDLSVGILLIGLVMLRARGIFNRTTAFLALATGVTGIVSAAGFFVTIMMNALCATIWVLLVGYRLCRLARA